MNTTPFIRLDRASVDIPIYNSRGRSLKTALMRQVGGSLEANDRDIVSIRALQDISIDVEPGDRLALVGHNGAGKSTLLRVFSGAYEPTSGRADINGSVSALLDITMGMDAELTGADNIVLRGVFVGMTQKEAQARMEEIADFSELGPYLGLPMRTYSSGMTMRLAFAISTARAPDILLLDEMISVGDAAFATKAKTRIQRFINDAHILVLASHDPSTLRRYCNKAVLLQGGSIVASGSVDDILEQYSGERAL